MNNQTRREFLKDCFRIGGYAGIACLGMGAVEDAIGFRILPAVVTGGVPLNSSWATWDETTEAGWGDSANTFICIMEGGLGSNEIGQGGLGLSEASRTLTQVGNIPAVSGGYRALDGTNHYFTVTSALANLISNANNTWTVILKCKDANSDTSNNHYYMYFKDAADGEVVGIRHGITNKVASAINEDAAGVDVDEVTDAIPADDPFYVGIWADGGANPVRCGYSITKPTKWSDFDATKRVTSSYSGAFIGENFAGNNCIGTMNLTAAQRLDFDLAYIIVSKSTLIDNAS